MRVSMKTFQEKPPDVRQSLRNRVTVNRTLYGKTFLQIIKRLEGGKKGQVKKKNINKCGNESNSIYLFLIYILFSS